MFIWPLTSCQSFLSLPAAVFDLPTTSAHSWHLWPHNQSHLTGMTPTPSAFSWPRRFPGLSYYTGCVPRALWVILLFGPSVFLINVISFSSVVCIGNYFGVVSSHSLLTGLLNLLLTPATSLVQHPKTIPPPPSGSILILSTWPYAIVIISLIILLVLPSGLCLSLFGPPVFSRPY